MRPIEACIPSALMSFLLMASGQASAQIVPASPVALEPVHLDLSVNNCDDIRGVELIEGGLRVLVRFDDRNGFICDSLTETRITLGAFAPGNYRVEKHTTFTSGAAPDTRLLAQFVVPPAATGFGYGFPREDLSGVWVTATEPSTGLFLVHSFEPPHDTFGAHQSLTGFWFIYEPNGTPSWYVIAVDNPTGSTNYEGSVLKFTATGTGSTRTVTPTVVGPARIDVFSAFTRVRATVDGRQFDFQIERFRWTRAAWPGTAPTDF